MSQDSIIIANASGSAVRAALNLALARLATNSSGTGRPADILAKQIWIDSDTPSSTVWSVYVWDGTHDVKVGEIDSTTGFFMPFVNGISAVSKFGGASITPQGRLTLSSTAPVLNADATAQTTVYYLPYIGQTVPVYDGSQLTNQLLGSSGINLALDSNSGHTNYQQSGKLFDLFAFTNSGTLTLGSGPAWTSSTARGSAAGTTELQRVNGIWTNKVSIALKIDATSSTVSVGANQATYLGTMYATANGQTGMSFSPAAAAGGGNPILGLYNAYNRELVESTSLDSTSSWTYASGTIRAANNSASNRVSWVDGLQQSTAIATSQVYAQISSANNANAGIGLDSTSTYIGVNGAMSSAASNTIVTLPSHAKIMPQLGFHFVSANESQPGGASTVTYGGTLGGGQNQGISLQLGM